MPLMRYFLFVGGALMALLLIADACLPALPATQTPQPATDLSVVRIHSDQKWPERVVFDTSRPTITPAPAAGAVLAETPAPQTAVAAHPLNGQVREAFAQVRNPSEPRTPGPKRKRSTVARNYSVPPRMLVAQQPPGFFFGRNIW